MKIALMGMTKNQLSEVAASVPGPEYILVPSDESPGRMVKMALPADAVVGGRFLNHTCIHSLKQKRPDMPINTTHGHGGASALRALLLEVVSNNGRARTRA